MNWSCFRHHIDILTGLICGLAVLLAPTAQARVSTMASRAAMASAMTAATTANRSREFASSSTLRTRTQQAQQTSESVLSGSLSLGYSQNLVDHQDGDKSTSGSGSVSLSGKLNPHWSLSGSIGFEENLKDSEDIGNGVSDLSLGLRNRRYNLTSWLSGKWSISASYPVSEYSIKVQNFQGSIGTRYGFSLTEEVLPKGFDLSFGIGGTRSFYKYETDTAGRILSPYSIRESFGVGYSTRRWDFSCDFSHAHRINFEDRVSQSFQLSQEIGYTIQPNLWKIAVGHSNGGSWLKSNDEDSNLEWINENDSVVYAQTELSF